MAIEIRSKHVFKDEYPVHKITKIKALHQWELPVAYLQGVPHCYKTKDGDLKVVPKDEPPFLIMDPKRSATFLTNSRLRELQKVLFACGNRLEDIRVLRPKLWEGTLITTI